MCSFRIVDQNGSYRAGITTDGHYTIVMVRADRRTPAEDYRAMFHNLGESLTLNQLFLSEERARASTRTIDRPRKAP